MSDNSTLKPIVLFEKHGMDTLEIAKLTGVSEAEVYNSLHKTRCRDSINWDHVAPEYNCMARDEYLLARLYRNKPVISGTFWTDGEISIYAKYFSSYKRGTVDWEDSLVIRPGHESSKP